ncbi:MAG: sugar phosphate isomerase/epimerase [Planctomycetes bacterium]|nr:sugar phosphate isomerase/epimerase [Planctomycetota bacterium]
MSVGKSFEDRIRHYVDAGIGNIEAGFVAHSEEDEAKILKRFRARYLLHNYFPAPREDFTLNLASANDEIRGLSRKMVSDALRVAEAAQAPMYSVHAGFLVDPHHTQLGKPFPEEGVSPREEGLARFIDTVGELAEEASSRGVQLLIENNVLAPFNLGKDRSNDKLLVVTADDVIEFFEAVPEVKMLLDFGHLQVSCHALNLDPLTEASRVRKYIRAFHCHSNNLLADQHQGFGPDVWWRDFISGFPDAWVILESRHRDLDDLRDHVKRLENMMAGSGKNSI